MRNIFFLFKISLFVLYYVLFVVWHYEMISMTLCIDQTRPKNVGFFFMSGPFCYHEVRYKYATVFIFKILILNSFSYMSWRYIYLLNNIYLPTTSFVQIFAEYIFQYLSTGVRAYNGLDFLCALDKWMVFKLSWYSPFLSDESIVHFFYPL